MKAGWPKIAGLSAALLKTASSPVLCIFRLGGVLGPTDADGLKMVGLSMVVATIANRPVVSFLRLVSSGWEKIDPPGWPG